MTARALVVVTCVLAACTGATPGPGPTDDQELWRRDPREPYPFVTPIPPRSPTPIDGSYGRRVTARLGGSRPIPCRRCAPYRLDRGRATLELQAGRFRVVHPAAAFHTSGHYIVEADRLILINDPVCPTTRGSYRWELEGDTLTLEALQDACAFDLLRARYLSVVPWHRS